MRAEMPSRSCDTWPSGKRFEQSPDHVGFRQGEPGHEVRLLAEIAQNGIRLALGLEQTLGGVKAEGDALLIAGLTGVVE
jgi:hypothetical protein